MGVPLYFPVANPTQLIVSSKWWIKEPFKSSGSALVPPHQAPHLLFATTRYHAGQEAFPWGLQPRLYFGKLGKDPFTLEFPKTCTEFQSSWLATAICQAVPRGWGAGPFPRDPAVLTSQIHLQFFSYCPLAKLFLYYWAEESASVRIYLHFIIFYICPESLKLLAFDTQMTFPPCKNPAFFEL